MEKELAVEFFQFVTRTLPNLLTSNADPMVALEALGSAWRENREHSIEDRDEEVAANRAEVDAKLAKRKRASRRKTPKKED